MSHNSETRGVFEFKTPNRETSTTKPVSSWNFGSFGSFEPAVGQSPDHKRDKTTFAPSNPFENPGQVQPWVRSELCLRTISKAFDVDNAHRTVGVTGDLCKSSNMRFCTLFEVLLSSTT